MDEISVQFSQRNPSADRFSESFQKSDY